MPVTVINTYKWVYTQLTVDQGCGLKQIMTKAPSLKILGAQQLSLHEESKFFKPPKDES